MELTQAQYELVAPLLPKQRGNVKLANIVVLNAILHMAENGCKWRALPERFGPWRTVYMRMYRWTKKGVLERVLARLQEALGVHLDASAMGLDSTSVKVHPDGSGAPKKTARRP